MGWHKDHHTTTNIDPSNTYVLSLNRTTCHPKYRVCVPRPIRVQSHRNHRLELDRTPTDFAEASHLLLSVLDSNEYGHV